MSVCGSRVPAPEPELVQDVRLHREAIVEEARGQRAVQRVRDALLPEQRRPRRVPAAAAASKLSRALLAPIHSWNRRANVGPKAPEVSIANGTNR